MSQIKSLLIDEVANYDTWHTNFKNNLEELFGVTPFFENGEGFFQQEFRGEWAATSEAINMTKVISESDLVSFDENDPYGHQELSWGDRFFTGVSMEAREI